MNILFEPWPWYVSGFLLGIIVPVMLWLGSSFGVSGNLDSICGFLGARKFSDHFDFNLKDRIPSLVFVLGSMVGGFLAYHWLTPESYSVDISDATKQSLIGLGVSLTDGLQPDQIFNWSFLGTPQGVVMLILGGFMIGFGTRYAGGCTSGHSISGMSALQPSSLVATGGFFIGGLIATHLLLPILFGA